MSLLDGAFFAEIHEKPESVAKLASVGLLVTSFFFLMGCWLWSNVSLEIPSILLGVAAIICLVLLSQQQVVILASVLIIGTIVTKEDFLLKVAALMSDHADDVPKGFYGEPQVTTEDLANLIREQLKAQTAAGIDVTPESAANAVDDVLAKATYADLARQIVREGADTPLSSLASGGEEWRSFADEFGSKDFFKDDMNVLKTLGLASCPHADFQSCKISSIGKQVNDLVTSGSITIDDLDSRPAKLTPDFKSPGSDAPEPTEPEVPAPELAPPPPADGTTTDQPN